LEQVTCCRHVSLFGNLSRKFFQPTIQWYRRIVYLKGQEYEDTRCVDPACYPHAIDSATRKSCPGIYIAPKPFMEHNTWEETTVHWSILHMQYLFMYHASAVNNTVLRVGVCWNRKFFVPCLLGSGIRHLEKRCSCRTSQGLLQSFKKLRMIPCL